MTTTDTAKRTSVLVKVLFFNADYIYLLRVAKSMSKKMLWISHASEPFESWRWP